MTPYKKLTKKLQGASASKLEDEANKLLFGAVSEPITRNGIDYRMPKHVTKGINCEQCGRPRAKLTASLCRACYLGNAKKKRQKTESFNDETYLQMLEGGGFENEQRVAIVHHDYASPTRTDDAENA